MEPNSNTYQAVEAFFQAQEWKYDETDGIFQSGLVLESAVQNAMIQVDGDAQGIVVLTALDYAVPEEAFPDVTALANLINMVIPMGSCFLDVEEQVVVFRMGQYYGEQITAEDVAEQVYFCLDMLGKIGDVLPELSEGGMTAGDAAGQVLRSGMEE